MMVKYRLLEMKATLLYGYEILFDEYVLRTLTVSDLQEYQKEYKNLFYSEMEKNKIWIILKQEETLGVYKHIHFKCIIDCTDSNICGASLNDLIAKFYM